MRMKRNPDLILRNIAGDLLLVPSGELAQYFNGMITLNEAAAFIWERIEEVADREEIVQKVLEEFEVEEEIARMDVHGFLDMTIEKHFVMEVPDEND